MVIFRSLLARVEMQKEDSTLSLPEMSAAATNKNDWSFGSPGGSNIFG
jgi:hypothetical protein